MRRLGRVFSGTFWEFHNSMTTTFKIVRGALDVTGMVPVMFVAEIHVQHRTIEYFHHSPHRSSPQDRD